MKVEFYDLQDRDDFKYSVIVSKDENGFIFVKHSKRITWEIPGGHIEEGESPLQAAKRELREETGANEFTIKEICDYSVEIDGTKTFGRLFYAEIRSFDEKKLQFEIEQVKSFTDIPNKKYLTYPNILPFLFKEVVRLVKEK